MRRFAFISRHVPTAEQHALAAAQQVELIHVGDADAFTCDIKQFSNYDGMVVVHPALALRLAWMHRPIGIFENGSRPVEGGAPQFFAKAFHVYHLQANEQACLACMEELDGKPKHNWEYSRTH